MIFTNDLSPILIDLGPVEIRWYGLFFAAGILFSYVFLYKIFKKHRLPIANLDSLAVYLFLGLVVGARLGHIIFYNLDYYLSNPLDIVKIWEGGLASHGAAIGLFIAYFIWIKVHKVKFSLYADFLVLPMPIAAACVRIGNFFNSEIIGKPTDGNWGVIFKKLGEDFPRHPAQLYEAVLSLIIFVVLLIFYKKYYSKVKPLFFVFLYVLLYFSGRFIAEIWKEQHGITPEGFSLAMGQILSILPIILAVIYFVGFYPRMKNR